MTKKSLDGEYSDTEIERRATSALRRALTTPYKPQAAMKLGRTKAKRKRARKTR